MSKRVDREHRYVERLEKELRELKQLNRSLLKRVKKLSRGYHKYLDSDPIEREDKKEVQIEKKICYDCGKGEYALHLILNRRWRQCDVCGKRGKTKIV